MKHLLKLFGGFATRKNTVSLSVVRMHAIGALGVYLEFALKSPATFTQMDIAVGKVEDDAAGVHCDVAITAFFYNKDTEPEYGHEGDRVPIPQQVIAQIRLRSNKGQVLRWETIALNATIKVNGRESCHHNTQSDEIDSFIRIQLVNILESFDRRFNSLRPWGTACLTGNHDVVHWKLQATL